MFILLLQFYEQEGIMLLVSPGYYNKTWQNPINHT